MSLDNLGDAFYHELRDILGAEKQLLEVMPKMIEAANCPDLKKALEHHKTQSEEHVERTEKAFEDTGKAARAKTCEAMKGILKETEALLKEDAECTTRDAMLIAAAQKIEHYEIATYGTLCRWAEVLDYQVALKELKQNIDEEEKTDCKLTEIAKKINKGALAGSGS